MAVDIVPLFLSRIMDRAKETGRKNIQTVLGSGQSTRLPAASVDKVFICDTYHHFEYPKSMLASIHQALKPGGEIILIDFKREEGTSSEWILSHVRAGQEVFSAEILAAGFEEVTALPILKDNYVVRFRKKILLSWETPGTVGWFGPRFPESPSLNKTVEVKGKDSLL